MQDELSSFGSSRFSKKWQTGLDEGVADYPRSVDADADMKGSWIDDPASLVRIHLSLRFLLT